jgi:hypothetical protein
MSNLELEPRETVSGGRVAVAGQPAQEMLPGRW